MDVVIDVVSEGERLTAGNSGRPGCRLAAKGSAATGGEKMTQLPSTRVVGSYHEWNAGNRRRGTARRNGGGGGWWIIKRGRWCRGLDRKPAADCDRLSVSWPRDSASFLVLPSVRLGPTSSLLPCLHQSQLVAATHNDWPKCKLILLTSRVGAAALPSQRVPTRGPFVLFVQLFTNTN